MFWWGRNGGRGAKPRSDYDEWLDSAKEIEAASEDWSRRVDEAVKKIEAQSAAFEIKQEAATGEFYVVRNYFFAIPPIANLPDWRDHVDGYKGEVKLTNLQVDLKDSSEKRAKFKTKTQAIAALKRWANPETIEYDYPPLVERKKENNQ